MTGDEDYPWAAMYRRALMCGIEDRAFWRMSPAALILVTSGMRSRGGRRQGGAGPLPDKRPAGYAGMAGGSLSDCP